MHFSYRWNLLLSKPRFESMQNACEQYEEVNGNTDATVLFTSCGPTKVSSTVKSKVPQNSWVSILIRVCGISSELDSVRFIHFENLIQYSSVVFRNTTTIVVRWFIQPLERSCKLIGAINKKVCISHYPSFVDIVLIMPSGSHILIIIGSAHNH